MSTTVYITYQCQLAAQTFLKTKTISGLDNDNVLAGICGSGEPKELPHVICLCQNAEADAVESGNWKARLSIAVRTNADDTTAADHHTLVNAVFSEFLTTTIAGDLSDALADFTAFRVVPVSQSWSIDDRSWIAEMEFDVFCCGSDIS
jgi:hypothetical protein